MMFCLIAAFKNDTRIICGGVARFSGIRGKGQKNSFLTLNGLMNDGQFQQMPIFGSTGIAEFHMCLLRALGNKASCCYISQRTFHRAIYGPYPS
ncbi:hypothetical protein HNY73_020904 [Argiope bruennichi]|uniref:Uncharacterized protein n=1 Tax=Argiope bruennichi TaxID=94029 RepID=A0A8T0E985_ARGBR|nr:hypothetical protein HNY73_020904 [Argiope bruennichi]